MVDTPPWEQQSAPSSSSPPWEQGGPKGSSDGPKVNDHQADDNTVGMMTRAALTGASSVADLPVAVGGMKNAPDTPLFMAFKGLNRATGGKTPSQLVQETYDKFTGGEDIPKTKAEKFVTDVVEFGAGIETGGAALGGAGNVIPKAASAIGYAAGNQVHPLLGFVGALMGGTIDPKEIPQTLERASPSEFYTMMKDAGIKITGDAKKDMAALDSWLQDSVNKVKKGVAGWTNEGEFGQAEAEKAQAGISDNYFDAKKQNSAAYNKVKDIGKDRSIVAKGLQNDAESILKEFNSNDYMTPKQETAVRLLKRWSSNIGEGKPSSGILDSYGHPMKTQVPDTISFNDLVDLKQALNRTYKPGDVATRPFQIMAEKVDNALAEASKAHPEFGEQLTKANRQYEEFSNKFDDKVLGQVWKDDDAYALKANRERGIPLPAETRKRAQAIISKIKTPVDIETITENMTTSDANAVKAAKIGEILGEGKLEDTKIEKNMPLLKSLVNNDPQAVEALQKIDKIAKSLASRGIKSNMPIEEKSQLQKSIAQIMNVLGGPKAMALSAAKEVVNPPSTNIQLMKNLSNEYKQGAPGYISPAQKSQQGVHGAFSVPSAPIAAEAITKSLEPKHALEQSNTGVQ